VDDQTALARIASDPTRAAILLDVDGTLAPIVERPEDARVPEETRAELERLHARYALVACVSGRTSEDARRIVGIDDLVYVGSHGLELAPDAGRYRGELHALAEEVDWPIEDKELTLSFHYRDVDDELAAVERLERVAELAAEHGLKARWGRKVLEVLPPVDADKGTAVRTLLEAHGLERALYAGDDATDLDAFAALDGLEASVRVAVVSDEGPSDLGVAADVVVGSTDALLELLRRL
jgi:trehalose 6-phosphate phosphatase